MGKIENYKKGKRGEEGKEKGYVMKNWREKRRKEKSKHEINI